MNLNESVITTANRYMGSISSELDLMPKRIKEIRNGEPAGFWFHNLACPCERLEKYFGAQLRNLGFTVVMDRIREIAEQARAFQTVIENGETPSTYLEVWNASVQALRPVLFFQ